MSSWRRSAPSDARGARGAGASGRGSVATGPGAHCAGVPATTNQRCAHAELLRTSACSSASAYASSPAHSPKRATTACAGRPGRAVGAGCRHPAGARPPSRATPCLDTETARPASLSTHAGTDAPLVPQSEHGPDGFGVHALQGAAAGRPRRLGHLPVRPGVVVLGVLAEARPGEIQLLRTRHPANWLWTRNRTRAAFQHRVMPGSARSHAATPWRHQASGTRRVACLHRIPQLLREVHRQAPSVARPALQARGRARVPGAAGGDARSPYWLDEVCRGTSEHATHNRHTPGLRQG